MGTRVRIAALMVVALLAGLASLAMAADEPAPVTVARAEQAPAADTACTAAVAADPTLEQGVTQNATGIVYFYDERRPELWVTLGTRHGLRPAAKVAIVRNGETVAEGCVADVKNADCVVRPAKGTPAGAIMLGDEVRVLLNGPRKAMDAKIHREHSDRALGAFAAFALLFGNIWAVRY